MSLEQDAVIHSGRSSEDFVAPGALENAVLFFVHQRCKEVRSRAACAPPQQAQAAKEREEWG